MAKEVLRNSGRTRHMGKSLLRNFNVIKGGGLPDKKDRGTFIVLEGGEGAGKTGALEFLKENLKGWDIVFTREPGGTPMAEEIRKVFLEKRDERVYVETELMLTSAARVQHVRNCILPALIRGVDVLSDRFSISTLAYQLYGRVSKEERAKIAELFVCLDGFAVGYAKPDFHVLLDIDPKEGLRRRNADKGDTTRIDAEDIEFHKRVREGFFTYLSSVPHAVVDASKSEDAVRREVLRIVKKQLGIK